MWLLRPGEGSESHEPEEMMVRYYEREHFDPYARIKAEGLNQWSDLHEELAGYENFPNRPSFPGAHAVGGRALMCSPLPSVSVPVTTVTTTTTRPRASCGCARQGREAMADGSAARGTCRIAGTSPRLLCARSCNATATASSNITNWLRRRRPCAVKGRPVRGVPHESRLLHGQPEFVLC